MTSTIIFLLLFFVFRRFCGGLHFEKTSVCLFFSIFLTLFIPFLCSVLPYNPISIIILQLFFSILLVIFPVIDNPNKTVTDGVKKIYKRHSIHLIIICFIINLFLIHFNMHNLSMIFLLAVITSFISISLGYVKYKKH